MEESGKAKLKPTNNLVKKRDLESCFDASLKPVGFKKKGGTWYQSNEETIVLIDLQKSNYGDQYYINIAMWIRALGESVFPKEHQCHVRVRFGSAFPQLKLMSEILFNLEEASLTDEQREDGIRNLLGAHILPLARSFESTKSLAEKFRGEGLKGALVLKSAQDLLSGVDA